jgi:hypothetical protein
MGGDAIATITLSPESWVRIVPGWATLYPSQPLQFTAKTSNVGNAGVIWSITPAVVGVIGSGGLYTAPQSIISLQKAVVTATSVMNPSVSQSITVWLSPPPFRVFAWDHSINVVQGSSATCTIAELATDGFPHPVAFSASGLPSGISASFVPATLTGTGSTILTLAATSAAAPGSYRFTVTGTDTIYEGLTHSRTMTLTIQASDPH